MPTDKYQSIFETTIDGIIVINERGIIEDINPTALTLFGYTKNELVGKNISVLMGEPHKAQHDSYLHNYKKTGKAKIIGIGREVEGKRKDGEFFPFRLAVSKYTSFDAVFYTGIIHDLTKQKEYETTIKKQAENLETKVNERTQLLKQEIKLREEAQKALIESQKLYETIAVNFPNGTISVLNREFIIDFIEGSALKELGFGTKRLTGKNLLDLLPEDLIDLFKSKLESVFHGQEVMFEFNQNQNTYKGHGVPLRNSNNEIEQILLVETNITQEKQAEAEIYKALQKEKQLNELKTKFVSMASHEFRTPLSGILSSASLIEKYADTTQQENRLKHINKIKNNVKNLTLILNDFLSLERIEEGMIKNNPEPILVSEFLSDLVEQSQPLLKKDQQIILEVSATDRFEVDTYLLTNVLTNLLSNASKYSNANITIKAKAPDKQLIIQVIDQGIGISKEDQQHLFNRFFRASNAGAIQGTGLGLNIVKRYITIMKADITFESELGKGSTFTITINGND